MRRSASEDHPVTGPAPLGPGAMAATLLAVVDDGVLVLDQDLRIAYANGSAIKLFGSPPTGILGLPIEALIPSRFHEDHRLAMAEFAGSSEDARRMSARSSVTACRVDGGEFSADISIAKWDVDGRRWYGALIRNAATREQARHREELLAMAGPRLGESLDLETVLRIVLNIAVPELADWAIVDIATPDRARGSRLLRRTGDRGDPRWGRSLGQLEQLGVTWDSPFPSIDRMRSGAPIVVRDVTDAWLEAHTAGPEELALYQQLAMREVAIFPMTVRNERVGALTLGLSRSDRTFDELRMADGEAVTALAALSVANALLYARAGHAAAARDRLLRIVSHDLRNPSSAIRMCATALVARPDEARSEREATYRTIGQAADTIHRLVNDLLDVTSIEAGTFVVETALQDPTPALEGLCEMFAARAQACGISLQPEIAPNLPTLPMDRDRITQALGNLLDNALRFTVAGGIVTLAARTGDGVLRVTVADTGTGIAPDDLSRLFDPDWHAAARPGGSGLGLPIALGIVAAHDGRLEVESTLGQGTRFTVHLPLHR